MMRMFRLVPLALIVLTVGCERMTSPTPAQCDGAIAHAVTVYIGANAKGTETETGAPAFMKTLKKSLKKGASAVAVSAFKLTDDYKKLKAVCQEDWTVHVTTCLSSGTSMDELAECRSWPWQAPAKVIQ